MQCRHARPRIDDFIGGTLNPEEATLVRQHIDACPSCKQDLESGIALHQAFRRLRLRNESLELTSSDMDRIARRAILSPVPAPKWPWLVAVAASLVLGVGLTLSLVPPRERVVTVVHQVPVSVPIEKVGFTWMDPEDLPFVEQDFIRRYNDFKRSQGRPEIRRISTNQ